MPAKEPPFIRFMKLYDVCDESGCWLWTGTVSPNGYGWLKAFGKVVSAHKFAYELYNGKIPRGRHVLHSCDVKTCVNPDHLRAGTHAENMAEASVRGLMASGDRHYLSGVRNPRPNQANRVLVLGKEYESQKAAERALGLGSGTVRYWIKTKPAKAKIISKGRKDA